MLRCLSLFVILIVWLGPAAAAPDTDQWGRQLGLQSGRLLVAAPHLDDPNFSRTVVLLVDYGPLGSRGVIVNRPTERDLTGDFGDQLAPPIAAAPLYFGGPVGGEHRLMLAGFGIPDDGGFEVVDGVYFIHGRRLMSGLARIPKPDSPYRVFAGYAGWGALQLEHEVARGDWFVVPASRHWVLELPPRQLWGELLRFYRAQMAALPSLRAGVIDG